MRRIIIGWALLLVGFFCIGQSSAYWQSRDSNYNISAGATLVNNMTVDGAANNNLSTGSTPVTLTTTKTNDIIVLMVEQNSCAGGPNLISVTDVAALTWTNRSIGASGGNIQEWFAPSSGILTADVITVTCSGGPTFIEVTAFGVHGGHLAAPYDVNGLLPYEASSGNGSITTSNAVDMLIAMTRGGSNSCSTSGFTAVISGSFSCTQTLNVTSTQSALTVLDPNSNNGIIADALIQGP